MSNQESKCPLCAGTMLLVDKSKLDEMDTIRAGTGLSTARAGVTCTALVGCHALPIRVYRCLTNWKTWRECRKLDAAAEVLWNTEMGRGVAIELKALSDARWKHILRHPASESTTQQKEAIANARRPLFDVCEYCHKNECECSDFDVAPEMGDK